MENINNSNSPPAPPAENKNTWMARNPKKTIFLVILLFTLLIDGITGLFFIPKDYNVYRSPHPYYHHDLLPNCRTTAKWGNITYPMVTDSLGFRDYEARNIPLKTSQKRMLIIGDSFTEGIGLPYRETVGGILALEAQPSGIEVLNAAVVSYSPKLYYLKTKYLIEEKHLAFDRLLVFIDISDIQNEIVYESFTPQSFTWGEKLLFQVKKFIKKTSFFYYSLSKLFRPPKDSNVGEFGADGLFPCFTGVSAELMKDKAFRRADSLWTLDATIFNRFGKKGLQLARQNMQQLVDLCKQKHIEIAVVVYPWPHQIRFHDLESVQVKFWRQFAHENSITFFNLFPDFIDDRTADTVYKTYFIQGDVHWNEAGHRLVADKVKEFLGIPVNRR